MLNLDTLILLLVIKNGQFLTLPLSPSAPMENPVAVYTMQHRGKVYDFEIFFGAEIRHSSHFVQTYTY